MSNANAVVEAGPAGIGGWLGLLAFGQTVGPLRTLGQISQSMDDYTATMTVPGGPMAVYGEVAINLVFFGIQVAVAIALWRKSTHFRRLFLLQWFAIPAVFVLDMAWVSGTLGVSVDKLMTPDTLGSTIGSMIGVGLWVWYVFASKRVKNTFVGPRVDTSAFA